MLVALFEIKMKKLSLLQGSILQGIAATFFSLCSANVLLNFNHFFAFIKFLMGFFCLKKVYANVNIYFSLKEYMKGKENKHIKLNEWNCVND